MEADPEAEDLLLETISTTGETADVERVEEAPPTIMDFMGNSVMMRNLFIVIVTWLSAAFGYTLIGFEIKYLPGSLYLNVVMSAFAEASGKLYGNHLVKTLGLKRAYTLAFMIAIVGASMVICADGNVESPFLLGCCLFLAKLGVAIGMLANYVVVV